MNSHSVQKKVLEILQDNNLQKGKIETIDDLLRLLPNVSDISSLIYWIYYEGRELGRAKLKEDLLEIIASN